MRYKTRRTIKQFAWAITFVIGYLTIWDLDRHAPIVPTPQDVNAHCIERGGVYIRALEGYVCVKLERL